MRPAKTSAIHFLSRVGVSVVGFIGTLYLSRVLGAEVLGIYVVVLSLVHWFNIPSTALSTAVTKRVSESNDKGKFLSAGFGLNGIVIGLLVVLVFFFRESLADYVGTSVTTLFMFVLVSHLVFPLVTAGLSGQSKVEYTGLLILAEQTLRVGAQIALILMGFRLAGALFGYGIAFLIAAILGMFFYDVRFQVPERIHFTSLIEYARYSWLGSIKSKVSGPAIDAIILNFFVGSSLIGIYQVSWNLATMLVMVGGSIQSALFPEISHLAAERKLDKVRNMLEEGLIFTGLFAIPGLFGAALIGPRVLRIYGSEFAQGGNILIILIVANMISAYGSQFTNTINGLDRPDLAFRINLGLISANLALNVILIPLIGWYGAAIATTVSTSFSLVFGYYYLSKLIGGIRMPVGEIGKQLGASFVMVSVVLILLPFFPAYDHVSTIGIAFLAATIYLSALLIVSKYVRKKIWSLV